MPNRDERTSWGVLRRALADRVCQVRERLYGVEGISELARVLGVPERTWVHYETGAAIPAEVILRFVAITHAEPIWLLFGQGAIFRDQSFSPPFEGITPAIAPAT